MLLSASSALSAHQLLAKYQVLSGRRARIECWYGFSDTSPQSAKLILLDADDTEVLRANFNVRGVAIIRLPRLTSYRARIEDGQGHVAILPIPKEKIAESFRRDVQQTVVACISPGGSPFVRGALLMDLSRPTTGETDSAVPSKRKSDVPWWKIVLGVALLLGIAGVVGLRRRLRGQT